MQIWVSTNASFRHDPVLNEKTLMICRYENIRISGRSCWNRSLETEGNQNIHTDNGPSLISRAQSGGQKAKTFDRLSGPAVCTAGGAVRGYIVCFLYHRSRGNIDWEEGTGTRHGDRLRNRGP